tara:strand:- start:135 stop:296 length:162 start_codon:yes stop_codon:yes gene_type:complete
MNLFGNRSWELTVGFYPGILIGVRTYEEKDYYMHVLYLPFIDVCLEIDKQNEQ